MTVQDLTEKYGISEAELYVYAYKHLKNFKKREAKEQTWKFSRTALRQLDWLLANERQQCDQTDKADDKPATKTDDFWPHDPTEDEPDDSKVAPPMIEAGTEKEENVYISMRTEEQNAWEEEKIEMTARMEAMQQELASLRHAHLTRERDAAEKQAELLAKAIHEKQLAESKIAVMKEDTASVKHLTAVRIKELEERNASLEEQLKETHTQLSDSLEELVNAQQTIQQITETANKEGAEQKLKLLDADHRQNELYKAIHEKELALAEEKEKTQAILEKYNASLLRIGEIIGKVEKARQRMKEISAEFDMYINTDTEEEEIVKTSIPSIEETIEKPEQTTAPVQQQQQPVNLETVEVLGKPLHAIYPEHSPQERATAKPSIWRKIASFF